MGNVYIEPRPKGRQEGTPIEDYVVEDHKDNVLKTFKTQKEAIGWAKKRATIPSSPASGMRTTRRSRITGGRRVSRPYPESEQEGSRERRRNLEPPSRSLLPGATSG